MKESKTKLRQRLFAEQKGECWICNELMLLHVSSNHPLFPTFDHIKPVTFGGTWDESNLKLAHKDCNNRRGNGLPKRAVARWQGNPAAQPFTASWLRAKGYM